MGPKNDFSMISFSFISKTSLIAHGADIAKQYYTVYSDSSKTKVLFLKGDEISVGDNYLSADNKYYEILSTNHTIRSDILQFQVPYR